MQQAASMGITQWQSCWVGWLGEAYLLAGRMDDAIRSAGRALELSRNHKERGHKAWVLRLLGEIASHPDSPDVETAEGPYRQAMALAGELGMRPLQAHCHLGLGGLFSKVGSREEARSELAAATDLYRSMDMTFWLPQAAAALARASSWCLVQIAEGTGQDFCPHLMMTATSTFRTDLGCWEMTPPRWAGRAGSTRAIILRRRGGRGHEDLRFQGDLGAR